MINLDQFYSVENQKVTISRAQACRFAKHVAGDFNPIHDHDAKRFCVPGDLLFAIILKQTGLSQSMKLAFKGMVGDETPLSIDNQHSGVNRVEDNNGKACIEFERDGLHTNNSELIQSLTKAYVEFSGQLFPDMFIDMMKRADVIINPNRPMVMYESMSLSLDSLDVEQVTLSLSSTELIAEGKRGQAYFRFDLVSDGVVVGQGVKHMVLAGLRPWSDADASALVNHYVGLKQQYAVAC